jgi:flagellin
MEEDFMGTIGTNIGALNASYYLTLNTDGFNKSVRRLASGSRLADPSDDAAGVGVSGRLLATIGRLGAAVDSTNNVISYAQTADGFLQTIQAQLTRMSELAQRATNGAFGTADRANYATEFNTLRAQVSNLLSNATFNGQTLFGSSAQSITVAINASGVTDSFTINALTTNILGIASSSIDTITNASSAISALNNAITTIGNSRAQVNADISKFNFHISNLRSEKMNVESANSRIYDLDIAAESTRLARYNILLQSATAMLTQANASQENVLGLLA